MRPAFVPLLLILAPALAGAAAEDSGARQWLEQMSRAAQSLNYEGTFVYQHKGRLEAMHIVHAMDEEGERERLLSLTGPEREVLRDDQAVTCILGDRRSVLVNRSRPRSPFPISFPTELMALEKHYRFEVAGEDRVAGLNCRVVAVQPRDELRYGRRLCVHEDSHLLLRSELTDARGEAIEQIMFTSVSFPEKIEREDLLPALNGSNFSWKREPDQPAARAIPDSQWDVSRLPDGFMLIDHYWHRLSESEPGVEHWVYSDGLASVSVYVEQSRDGQTPYRGVTHRGALNVFGTMVDGYHVTVIGEVPAQTVELIGNSVNKR